MTNGTKSIKNRKNSVPAAKQGVPAFLYALGFGTLLGAGVWLALALLFSGLAVKSATPQSFVFPSALAAVFAGGYAGGLFTAKKSGGNPYIGGLACGGTLLLLLLFLSLFFRADEGRSALQRFASPLVLLLAAALGGLTAAMHRPSHAKQMKKLTKRARGRG